MIAIDFESYLINEEQPWPKPVCLSYHSESTTGLAVGMKDMTTVLKWAFAKDEPIIAHNATFECGLIYTHFPEFREQMYSHLNKGLLICTQINAQLINNYQKKRFKGVSLADQVLHYFKEDISEGKKDPSAWRLNYSKLDGVPKERWPQAASDYAIQDSIWAYKLYQKQIPENLKPKEFVRASVLLNLMASKGMHVDQERVNIIEQEVKEVLQPKYKKLLDKGFYVELKNSWKPKKRTKELQEYIKKVVKYPIYTQKGGISTAKDSLIEYYTETFDDVFKTFEEISEYEKIITTYTKNLKADLIRTKYKVVMATGRTSSSGDRNYPSVNIQNQPRSLPENLTWDIRNCYVPTPGYKILCIDYGSLEPCIMAQQLYNLYGESKLLDVLNSGDSPVDLHSKFACQVMSMELGKKVTYEEFMEKKGKDPDFKKCRQMTKEITNGFPGGRGVDSINTQLIKQGIDTNYKVIQGVSFNSEKEAWEEYKKARHSYPNLWIKRTGRWEWKFILSDVVKLRTYLYEAYPELKKFLKHSHKEFQTGEVRKSKNDFGDWETNDMYAYSIDGFVRDYATYTAFCNGYLMQAPAARGAKIATANIIERYLDHPKVRPLAFIHDELDFEVLDCPQMYDIISDIEEMMIVGMQESVAPDVRITVESSLDNHWSKEGGGWSRIRFRDPGSNIVRTK